MSILFLYSEISGHSEALVHRIAALSGQPVVVVHWDRRTANSTAHRVEAGEGVRFVARSTLDRTGIAGLIADLAPTLVYVAGWMDKDYLAAIARRRFGHGQHFVTIAGIDDKWAGSLRQHIGSAYFRLRWRRLIDRLWVAGPEQYHYARRFGYRPQHILPFLLAADTDRFATRAGDARRFVFVGRLDPRKGVDLLVEAYRRLPASLRRDWSLVVIGDGEQAALCRAAAGDHVRLLPFLQPPALVLELAAGGVGVFPSRNDQWGVSMQELAAMGYPLVASDGYGAAIQFLIPGYNGIAYPALDVAALTAALAQMAGMADVDRARMAQRSAVLGASIRLDYAAASFLSAGQPAPAGKA